MFLRRHISVDGCATDAQTDLAPWSAGAEMRYRF